MLLICECYECADVGYMRQYKPLCNICDSINHASPCLAKMPLISWKTWSGSTSELTLQFLLSSEQYFMISLVSLSQVRKRFFMLLRLSSERPLVSPRFSKRLSMTSSPHSRCKMKGSSILSFMMRSQVDKFSILRGKPSIKNLPPSNPAFLIAFSSSITVISLGTILPQTMLLSMIAPYWDPGVLRSSRRRSPAERWVNLNSLLMRSLWVPLPEPGPPRMKTTVVLFLLSINKSQQLLSINQSFTFHIITITPYSSLGPI